MNVQLDSAETTAHLYGRSSTALGLSQGGFDQSTESYRRLAVGVILSRDTE